MGQFLLTLIQLFFFVTLSPTFKGLISFRLLDELNVLLHLPVDWRVDVL